MKEPVLFKDAEARLNEANSFKQSWVAPKNTKKFDVKMWNEVTPSGVAHFTIRAEEGAHLEYVLFQNLPLDASSLAQVKVIAEKNASIKLTFIQQGASLSHLKIETQCMGEGSDIQIRGLQNAKLRQKFSFEVHSIHSVPHTRSELTAWCVVRDQAHSIFNGLVSIKENAHHTEAFQKNKNLILSEKGTVDSFPKLLIANDEVKCAHGSSTSTLEPEQFMYLQSRGIDRDTAENMLTSGFLHQVLDWISDESVRTKLELEMGVHEEGFSS